MGGGWEVSAVVRVFFKAKTGCTTLSLFWLHNALKIGFLLHPQILRLYVHFVYCLSAWHFSTVFVTWLCVAVYRICIISQPTTACHRNSNAFLSSDYQFKSQGCVNGKKAICSAACVGVCVCVCVCVPQLAYK